MRSDNKVQKRFNLFNLIFILESIWEEKLIKRICELAIYI